MVHGGLRHPSATTGPISSQPACNPPQPTAPCCLWTSSNQTLKHLSVEKLTLVAEVIDDGEPRVPVGHADRGVTVMVMQSGLDPWGTDGNGNA